MYSSKIGDLLVRTAMEVESLSKVLYFENGGTVPAGRDLYFDTDCLQLLDTKWNLSQKIVFVSSPFFYFVDTANIILTPLRKAHQRGSSSSKWQQAYQAVKHDRINNLKKGSIGNLIQALGALYILNIYYRNASFDNLADKEASNIDWGLGSNIFSVKVSHETSSVAINKIYVKKSDFDECIYLVKHTDKSANALMDVMKSVNKQIQDEIVSMVSGDRAFNNDNLLSDKVGDNSPNSSDQLISEASKRVLDKEKYTIHDAYQKLRFEAVLNKNQY